MDGYERQRQRTGKTISGGRQANNALKLDFSKGLLPAIAQEAESKNVLMLGFVDEEAVRLTLDTGYAHYYSRSKQRIWKKGEESGHLQKIVDVLTDCDNDTVLYIVEQTGVACHTGAKSYLNSLYLLFDFLRKSYIS